MLESAIRRQLLAAGAVLLVAALIAVGTLTPLGAADPRDRPSGDVCAFGLPCPLGHLGSFAALGAALAAWEASVLDARRDAARPARRALAALGLGLSLAAADEAAQALVGRDPQLADWLLDATGLLAGYAIAAALLRRARAALARRR
jgi:hypothetical protein